MNLSKQTLDILKNFAQINSNLKIPVGKKIATISATKDIYAIVEVAETFPKEAGIFNLNEFLGVVSLFQKPEYEFGDKQVIIKEGRNKIQYVYSDPSLLTVPTKEVKFPETLVEFDLTADMLAKIQKASSALSVNDLALVGDGKAITVKVFDSENSTANTYEFELEEKTDKQFSVHVKIEKLKILPGSYKVSLAEKKVISLKNKDISLTYMISSEATNVK